MMGFLLAASVVFIGLVLVLVKLTRHFASPQHLPVSAEWIEELSIERYRPMLRLLNQEDLHFLHAQPGFTPQMATNFRIQRCQLFQEYLRHLDNDFKRICMALKVLMVEAKHDRPRSGLGAGVEPDDVCVWYDDGPVPVGVLSIWCRDRGCQRLGGGVRLYIGRA